MIKQTILAASVFAAMAVAGTATAGSNTGTLNVNASITPVCIISSTKDIAFGSYDAIKATDTEAAGEVGILCAGLVSNVTVDLDEGAHKDVGSTAAAPKRRLSDGTNFLNYAVSQSPGSASPWATGAGQNWNAGSPVAGVELKQAAYGIIPKGQFVVDGTYTDTITATVSF